MKQLPDTMRRLERDKFLFLKNNMAEQEFPAPPQTSI